MVISRCLNISKIFVLLYRLRVFFTFLSTLILRLINNKHCTFKIIQWEDYSKRKHTKKKKNGQKFLIRFYLLSWGNIRLSSKSNKWKCIRGNPSPSHWHCLPSCCVQTTGAPDISCLPGGTVGCCSKPQRPPSPQSTFEQWKTSVLLCSLTYQQLSCHSPLQEETCLQKDVP